MLYWYLSRFKLEKPVLFDVTELIIDPEMVVNFVGKAGFI